MVGGWRQAVDPAPARPHVPCTMKPPSIALALVASFTAALVIAALAMPPASILGAAQAGETGMVAQAQPGSSSRRDDQRNRQREQRALADCHRDVRTHRINGVMVTHRHVGANCAVRVVNRSSEPATPLR